MLSRPVLWSSTMNCQAICLASKIGNSFYLRQQYRTETTVAMLNTHIVQFDQHHHHWIWWFISPSPTTSYFILLENRVITRKRCFIFLQSNYFPQAMWNGNCWCCWGSKHRSPCNWQPRYPSSYMTILNLEWPWKPPSDAHPCPSDIQVVRWVLQLRNKPPEIQVLITLNFFITLGRSFSFFNHQS